MSNASVFSALADPTRRSLLLTLAEHDHRTATQFADDYPITRQGVLKHLHVLKDAGLVTVYQQGREKRYVLTPEPLSELVDWVDELNTQWEARLQRLKAFVESAESR